MHACTYTKCELCDENYFSMTFNVRLNAYISYSKERHTQTDRERERKVKVMLQALRVCVPFSYFHTIGSYDRCIG